MYFSHCTLALGSLDCAYLHNPKILMLSLLILFPHCSLFWCGTCFRRIFLVSQIEHFVKIVEYKFPIPFFSWQNTTCHLFRLYSYRHMLPRCSTKMKQMAPLLSLCVICHVWVPHWLCLLTWTDEKTSGPSRDFPWAGLSQSCSSTSSSCVTCITSLWRSLFATVTRTVNAVNLCVVVSGVVRPSRGRDTHFDKWGTHRGRVGGVAWLNLPILSQAWPFTVFCRNKAPPIHAAFCQSKYIAMH